MTPAETILRELSGIGASVQPSGSQLVLRAGSIAIPALLVRRVRESKSDIIALLQDHQIVRWLDQHPAPSRPGTCAWCGAVESPGAVVLPFGTEPESHTWLHAECWKPWHGSRRAEAARALTGVPA